MKPVDLFAASLVGVVGASVCTLAFAGAANANKPEGQRLFEQHGCTNCHGADGVHPEARYVPVLRGKPAAELYAHASKIFSGESASDKTAFMHDQFCIGQMKEEGCYEPPSDEALRVIADWLGGGELPEKKQTQQGLYVSAMEAFDQLQALKEDALFIDVRSRAEVAFVGAPEGIDANIPYMTVGMLDEWDEQKQTFKMQPNSEFTMRVNELVEAKGLGKETPIYLICRSGSRSAKAANLLHLAGYAKVYSVTDGFEGDKAKTGPRKGERVVNGWKNAGLPWTYKLKKTAMYWEL
jgi:rhodanese-related sulfurtransferase/cytochrome c553